MGHRFLPQWCDGGANRGMLGDWGSQTNHISKEQQGFQMKLRTSLDN